MVRALWLMAVFAVPAALAEKQIFDASELQAAAEEAADQQSESNNRFKSMRSGEGLKQIDQSFLTFEVDGHEFPGVILPNERVAPSVLRGNRRVPACLDTYYRPHPGRYDPETGGVQCDIRQADLLINEQVDQKSVGARTVAPPELPDTEASVPTVSKYEAGLDEGTEQGSAPPPEPKPEPQEPKPVRVSKSQDSQSMSAGQGDQAELPEDLYIPPIRTGAGRQATTTYSVVSEEQKLFGIRKGTWAEVEIRRRVSSADHGEVEILLLEPIHGRYRVLPASTILFARPVYNSGTERLDLQITNGMTPEDEEISLLAYAYDQTREAGLSGTIRRDREGEFSSAVNQGALAALQDAASRVPLGSGNPVSSGVEQATDTLINTEQKYANPVPAAVIEVTPQRFFIQFAQSI